MLAPRLAALSLLVMSVSACTHEAQPLPSPVASTGHPSPDSEPSLILTPVASAACPSRATRLDATEATEIAAASRTGEVWSTSPVRVDAPAGDQERPWFLLGSRGDVDIVATPSADESLAIAERASDGSLTWIDYPTPTSGGAWTGPELDGVGHDTERCYESLALPSSVSTTFGFDVPLPSPLSSPQPGLQFDGTVSEIGRFGPSTVLEVSQTGPFGTEAEPLPVETQLVHLEVALPFGWYQQVELDPFADADTVTGFEVVDYFDYGCGSWRGQALRSAPVTDENWSPYGSIDGRELFAATPANPYALERYQAYLDDLSAAGLSQPADYDAFIANGAVVAVRSDNDQWWVGLNRAFAPRPWC